MFPLGQMPSFEFTEEMRRQALKDAIRQAGLGMMGAALGGARSSEAFGQGLLGGAKSYQQAPMLAQKQWKSQLDAQNDWISANKNAMELQKLGRESEQHGKQQDFFGMLTDPYRASMAGGGGPSVKNLTKAQNYQSNPLAMLTDPTVNIRALQVGVDPSKLGAIVQNARPYEQKPGMYYDGRYLEDPTKGMKYDGQRVTQIPGWQEAQNASTFGNKSSELSAQLLFNSANIPNEIRRAGGVAGADAEARANYDPFTYTDESGNPRQTTRGAYVRGFADNVTRIDPRVQAQRDAVAQGIYDAEGAGKFSPRLNDRPGAQLNAQVANLGIPSIRGQNPARAKENSDMASFLVNDYYKPITAEAQKAATRLPQTEYLLSKLDKGELKVGALTPFATEARRYLVGAGLATEAQAKTLADNEVLRKFGPELILSGPRLEGPQSNMDTELYRSMYANEKDSPRGFDLTMSMMRANDLRKKEKASFVNAYRNANGTLEGAEQAWQNGAGNRSLFEDKRLTKFLPTTVAKSGPLKGKKVVMLPDGRVMEVE